MGSGCVIRVRVILLMAKFETMENKKLSNEAHDRASCLGAVTCCTDLEWSLYKQVVEMKEKVKKLEFMIENGLGWEDMENDITMPHEL
jgi:hypothetical protein